VEIAVCTTPVQAQAPDGPLLGKEGKGLEFASLVGIGAKRRYCASERRGKMAGVFISELGAKQDTVMFNHLVLLTALNIEVLTGAANTNIPLLSEEG
jgi:hypothetical protein